MMVTETEEGEGLGTKGFGVKCWFEVLQASVEGPCLHRPENWLTRQLKDEPKPVYKKGDLLERKERPQLEQCSGAWKSLVRCSSEGWGFYGCFNSGFGRLCSLAMICRLS
jgi:hypothetical protein